MKINDKVVVRVATSEGWVNGEHKLEQAKIVRIVNDSLWVAITNSGREILISPEHIEQV